MGFVLWLIAAVLVIWGVITLINGSILWGLILILIGCAIGPGGWSIWGRRRAY